MGIVGVRAREVLDSRGNPTVECELTSSDGIFRAIVPSGASTGTHEALELRDGDTGRYLGKGVHTAVRNINEILGPAIVGMDPTAQADIDQKLRELDGTQNKSRLGANAILAVSMACCRAGAAARAISLAEHIAQLAGTEHMRMPIPSLNVINGGVHAGNMLAIQEFMILPVGASSFADAMRIGAEVYHRLKKLLKEKYGSGATSVGDEGGFAPPIDDAREVLAVLQNAIKAAGHEGKVRIGLDCAASEFHAAGAYDLGFKSGRPEKKSGAQLGAYYRELISEFGIISIEDPFAEDDWDAFAALTASTQIQIVGDDLLVTNPLRIREAIERGACNALLLKINQIGTISESIDACATAQSAGWGVMVSHRSGETEDAFIADLAVGLGAGQIKSGAPCRSERLAKYNQLLRIEEELGCAYARWK